MSPSRFTISRLFSAFALPSRSPGPAASPEAHDTLPSPYEKAVVPSPGTPVYGKGEASPTETLTGFHELGIDTLPYVDTPRSGTASTVISRLPSKHDVTTPLSAETPAIPRARARLWCSFLVYVCIGWGDGATGTVLPYFQSDFKLSYTTTSVIFLASAVGILTGTFTFEVVTKLLGQVDVAQKSSFPPFLTPSRWSTRKDASTSFFSDSRGRCSLLCGSIVLHGVFYAMMGSKSGYVCLLLAFIISGVARAWMFGILNTYVALLPGKPFGQLHGAWGLGGFASPLICQAMISSGAGWNLFYFASLGWSLIAATASVLIFYPTAEERAEEAASAVPSLDSGLAASPVPPQSSNTLLKCLKTPMIWAFSVFLFIYSGSETSANGFIVSYLLKERDANPKVVGYFAGVFWAGFTIARVLMGIISPRRTFRTVKYMEHGLMLSALVFNLCIWLVTSLPANVVFVGLVGFSVGPMFPTTVYLATFLLPQELHMVGISLLSAAASAGSAVLPFISGLLSNQPKIGLDVLPKMLVAEGCVLLILWYFFPSTPRTEATTMTTETVETAATLPK